jgi:hypothetical protein
VGGKIARTVSAGEKYESFGTKKKYLDETQTVFF